MHTIHLYDLPEHLYSALEHLAAQNGRSLNDQVLELLSHELAADAGRADALREQGLSALARIAEGRRRTPPVTDGVDSLAMVRQDRDR